MQRLCLSTGECRAAQSRKTRREEAQEPSSAAAKGGVLAMLAGQKGAPEDVVISSGKLKRSCEIESEKCSSNLRRDQTTHASSVSGFSTRLA